jgi:hypothetical protein
MDDGKFWMKRGDIITGLRRRVLFIIMMDICEFKVTLVHVDIRLFVG